ncbi:transcriptional regulator [Kozakia baliensis NRIC 0488]|uniref:LysR family transcriptional regulator n=2 Tax=Kozakia baliensis TaxID=153496 RepID=A0A1D8UYP7_9PROT|nr:LysR family transcriptional regulator [Kozakia baliensis]GBR33206.1 transcriptional regulator [Kozakia baliensis NRIC 0488]GEL65269.1 LysR family transcriptional regulator [Kozakia baliensis]
MIIRNFEYLLALAAEGHFGRAAESCHVSQPTLSAGIRQLEEDLDVEIVRHGRRYDGLTKEGEAVLDWAKRMQRDCNALENELAARKRGVEGDFRFGAATGASGVAPVLSRRLAERMPQLRQTVSIHDPQVILEALRAREIDISLTYLDDATGEFDGHLLYQERLFLFRSTREPQPAKIAWENIGDLSLCILPEALQGAARSRLIQNANPAITTNAVEVLAAHVATGNFAAILPQSYACYLAHIPDLRATALAGPDTQIRIGFVTLTGGLRTDPGLNLFETTHEPAFERVVENVLFAHREFCK